MNNFICPEQIEESVLPKYYQIYTQLKKEIFFREYKPGERFFSLRKLKDIYVVNMQTVREAVKLLIEDGFLLNQPASGIYTGKINKKTLRLSMGNLWYCQFGKERNHPYYNSLIAGLQHEAKSYKLNCVVNENSDKEDFLRWFRPETGDGVAVTGEIDHEIVSLLRGIPYLRYVVIGNYELPEGIPNIRHNAVAGVRNAIEIAASLGKKRIALIAGPKDRQVTKDILQGISLVPEAELVKGMFSDEEEGYLAMSNLEKRHDVDCIVVTEPAYYGMCRYVFENKIKCPDELFVIRFGKNEERNSYDDIAALNLSSNKDALCKNALKFLFSSKTPTMEVAESLTISDSVKKNQEKRNVVAS